MHYGQKGTGQMKKRPQYLNASSETRRTILWCWSLSNRDLLILMLVTSLYSHDIILVLFCRIKKQDYMNKYLVTGDWGQSTFSTQTAGDKNLINPWSANLRGQYFYFIFIFVFFREKKKKKKILDAMILLNTLSVNHFTMSFWTGPCYPTVWHFQCS